MAHRDIFSAALIIQISLSCFYGTILESYRENLVAHGVSHALPAGSWQVTVTFTFVSDLTYKQTLSAKFWILVHQKIPTT